MWHFKTAIVVTLVVTVASIREAQGSDDACIRHTTDTISRPFEPSLAAVAAALSDSIASATDCEDAKAKAKASAPTIAEPIAEVFESILRLDSYPCGDDSFAFSSADATSFVDAISKAYIETVAKTTNDYSEEAMMASRMSVEEKIRDTTAQTISDAFVDGDGERTLIIAVGQAVAVILAEAFAVSIASVYC